MLDLFLRFLHVFENVAGSGDAERAVKFNTGDGLINVIVEIIACKTCK